MSLDTLLLPFVFPFMQKAFWIALIVGPPTALLSCYLVLKGWALMGDAISQPVLQGGQMLTILGFLFLQSFWFGLAGIALIPLQAWLIPLLQRQINLLNKERIKEVRHLSAEIGETAAGITDLRTNGGWRFRLAEFTGTLGRLFGIRFKIYQKKFFMKMTPKKLKEELQRCFSIFQWIKSFQLVLQLQN